MKKSANLEVPPYLLPWETETFGTKQNCLFNSINKLKEVLLNRENYSNNSQLLPNDSTTDFNILTTDSGLEIVQQAALIPPSIKSMLEDDLSITSSDTDPFAGDDDLNDPNFEIPDIDQIDDNTDEECKTVTKKSRKRHRNETDWKRNIIKKSRNTGKSYVSWKGKFQAKRELKASCVTCRMKCTEKFAEEERRRIFDEYWKLGDINRQRDFISKCVKFNMKARNRSCRNINSEKENSDDEEDKSKGKPGPSRRAFTFVYGLPKAGTNVQVCKTFFLNTLCISAQTVRTVYGKMGSAGLVAEDKRGKVCKNSLIDESIKQTIRDHINSFETIESHYCRKNNSRVYLPPTLSISKMFSLYQEFCEEQNITQNATESMYRSIFSSEFNISFFKPKKDLCDSCHKYENSTSDEKLELEEDHQEHIRNKNLGRELKNDDKEKALSNSNFCAATFDLQQVLSAPKSDVGLAYYKLKLATYNFTVFNLASKDCFCYMWHECIAKRGASEIGSSLLLFIEHQIKNGVKEFSFYSDNCAGQNRNKFLFSLYNFLSQKHKIIIRHNFLERGHTQTEGDSVHSVIEKAARSIPVYTPEQWYTVVRTAKRKQPYFVVEMEKENIFDLKALQRDTTLNWDKNEANEKVYWNKLKIVETNPDFPNVLLYKCDCTDRQFCKMILTQRGRKSINVNFNNVRLKQLYFDRIPLSKKKYDHLQFLCQKKVILSQYHDFFNKLPYSLNAQSQSDSDE